MGKRKSSQGGGGTQQASQKETDMQVGGEQTQEERRAIRARLHELNASIGTRTHVSRLGQLLYMVKGGGLG